VKYFSLEMGTTGGNVSKAMG